MNPISPVVQGQEHNEHVYAKDQPEYKPLPVLRLQGMEGICVSRWEPTREERMAIAAGADVILSQWTFRHPMQPVLMQVCRKDEVPTV